MEANGWFSQRKGRKKRRKRKEKEEEMGPEVIERRLLEASTELENSEFWDSTKTTILERLRDHFAPLAASEDLRCVCYGAGNFSVCASARYQLAFLLAVLRELGVPRRLCDVFDPAFSDAEAATLARLGFAVMAENEEGKRRVAAPTLFFMVHCGKALYNNLLWRNWRPGALAKMAVVGNSFRGVAERFPRRTLETEYWFVAKISDAADETAFPPDGGRFGDAFGDTSLHCFPAWRLRGLPPETWDSPEEPLYGTEDLEIVRRTP